MTSTATALSAAGLSLVLGPTLGLLLLVVPLQEEQAAAVAVGSVAAGAPVVLASDAVPGGWAPLLLAAAATCPAVTAPLLAGQLEVESGWDPAAVSPAGAQGLAQFTPVTWARYGGDGVSDPLTPADAIPAQARYLCQLVADTSALQLALDPVDLALAAYNAGPQAVAAARGIPPYPETQAYVPRVRAAAARYATPASDPSDPIVPLPVAGAGWVSPAAGMLTSRFGPRWGEVHEGIDIAVPVGTPVRAAQDGTVAAAGPAEGFGRWVVLDHAGGLRTVYGHLSAERVVIGQPVHAGQTVALSGNTGDSRGPHLHFEVHVNGRPEDPLVFYALQGAQLP